MKTFTNSGEDGSYDIVHLDGNKDNYSITENAGKLTYESSDRTYILDAVEEIGFKIPNENGAIFKWDDEFSPFFISFPTDYLFNYEFDTSSIDSTGVYTGIDNPAVNYIDGEATFNRSGLILNNLKVEDFNTFGAYSFSIVCSTDLLPAIDAAGGLDSYNFPFWLGNGFGLNIASIDDNISSAKKVVLCQYTGSEWVKLTDINKIVLGKKYNIGGTWDGNTLKLFINGILTDSIAISSINSSGNYMFGIGGYGLTGDYRQVFNGAVDDIKVWNYAQTDEHMMNIAQTLGYAGVPTDYIAYYPLTVDTSSTTGNYDGTNYGTTFTNDVASFDGVDDYITLPLDFFTTISMNFWLKINDDEINRFIGCGSEGGDSIIQYFARHNDDNTFVFFASDGTAAQSYTTTNSFLFDNKYANISLVWLESSIKIYINGQHFETATFANPRADTSVGYIQLMKYDYYHAGNMSSFKVYNRELNAVENNNIFEVEKGDYI